MQPEDEPMSRLGHAGIVPEGPLQQGGWGGQKGYPPFGAAPGPGSCTGLGRCSGLGVLVQPASFPAAQQYLPFCRASVSPQQPFMSPGKGVSPGQGQAETPVLLQRVPSWGQGCMDHTAVRIRPRTQAREGNCFQGACVPGPGSVRAAGKPAHRRHAAAVPIASSARPWALAPVGCRQHLPKWHKPSSWRSCCCPGVHCAAVVQTRGAGPDLRPPARCWDGTQQCPPPAPSGFPSPWQIMGLFPSPRCRPLSPHPCISGRMDTLQSPGCHGGQGLVSEWGPWAGTPGWVRHVPRRFVVPGTLP